jgi:hypothetical protein
MPGALEAACGFLSDQFAQICSELLNDFFARRCHKEAMASSSIGYPDLIRRAENCERLAEKTDNPTLAEGFRQLADQWRRSAELHQSQEDLLNKESALVSQLPEQRREMRRRVLKAGRIVFNNRQSTLDCTVKNISSQGALVTLPSTTFVPEEIELCIGNETHKARVIWRAADKMGLAWT